VRVLQHGQCRCYVFQVLKPTAEADNMLSFSDDEDNGDDDDDDDEGKSVYIIYV